MNLYPALWTLQAPSHDSNARKERGNAVTLMSERVIGVNSSRSSPRFAVITAAAVLRARPGSEFTIPTMAKASC